MQVVGGSDKSPCVLVVGCVTKGTMPQMDLAGYKKSKHTNQQGRSQFTILFATDRGLEQSASRFGQGCLCTFKQLAVISLLGSVML